MDAYYSDDLVELHHGDCLNVLRSLPDASVDAVCTDPPYGLGFMGKAWDDLPPGLPFATECLRVLKPGGHLLAFGGTRTWHRLACAVEDAGFEVRDSIAWMYGSGFPKSLDVSKAIDKARADDPAWRVVGQWLKGYREAAGYATRAQFAPFVIDGHKNLESAAANVSNWENGLSFPTWDRWLSLKAILSLPDDMDAEVWRLNGRKGLPGEAWESRGITGRHLAGLAAGDAGVGGSGEGKDRRDTPATPDAERWLGWGTALKPAFEPIVVARKPLAGTVAGNVTTHGTGALNIDGCRVGEGGATRSVRDALPSAGVFGSGLNSSVAPERIPGLGRWPANVILDESQAAELDAQSGERPGDNPNRAPRQNTAEAHNRTASMGGTSADWTTTGHADNGGASRFFYVAKADQSERVRVDSIAHPTVKPLALMRWLVRLVTPPGGTVLEPFAGSGTTVEACILEGFQCIAIEREADYLPLIVQRINRRRDPVAAVKATGDDGGLFDLLGGGAA